MKPSLALFAVALSTTLTLISPAWAGPGNGGGGNVFPELKTVDTYNVMMAIDEAYLLRMALQGVQVSLFSNEMSHNGNALQHAQQAASAYGLSKDELSKLFIEPGNLIRLAEYVQEYPPESPLRPRVNVQDDPCFDPHDINHLVPKDASPSGSGSRGTICFSVDMLKKDTAPGELRTKLLALMAHELTHLVLGDVASSESKADGVQRLTEASLDGIGNFNSLTWLNDLQSKAIAAETASYEKALMKLRAGDTAEACALIKATGDMVDVFDSAQESMRSMAVSQYEVKDLLAYRGQRYITREYLLQVCEPRAILQISNGQFEKQKQIDLAAAVVGAHIGFEYDVRPLLNSKTESAPVLMKATSVRDPAFAINLQSVIIQLRKMRDAR